MIGHCYVPYLGHAGTLHDECADYSNVWCLISDRMLRERELMSENGAEHNPHDLPYAGKGCPKCGYNLTGTTEPKCPECGQPFHPAMLRPVDKWYRPPWFITLPSVVLAAYLPNAWILLTLCRELSQYWQAWLKAFPFMPALTPLYVCISWANSSIALGDNSVWVVTGVTTFLLILSSFLIARRSWRHFVWVTVGVFGFELLCAIVYHIYYPL